MGAPRLLKVSPLPQWSPVTKTGKTAPGDPAQLSVAAMEPGHEDREDDAMPATKGGLAWCRNGARSRRPGRPTERPASSPLNTGRNGARSRRPGRPLRDRRRTRPRLAAMEPGHEDREDCWQAVRVRIASANLPQWSPVTKTGKTDRGGTACMLDVPQWSPVTKTGKTARAHARDDAAGLAAMEPGHEDREDPGSSRARAPSTCRNGARSRRPGRPARPRWTFRPCAPQWSPVTKTGKTKRPGLDAAGGLCRNGARSRRPGRGRLQNGSGWPAMTRRTASAV